MTFDNYISFDNLTLLTFANVLILLPSYHDSTVTAFLKWKISTQTIIRNIVFLKIEKYEVCKISEYFKQENYLLSKHFFYAMKSKLHQFLYDYIVIKHLSQWKVSGS